jgi:hypothetical protein
MRALSRTEVDELRVVLADFERRMRRTELPPGVIEAIPRRIAHLLLDLGWRVDDDGGWVSPRDGRSRPWPAALEEELARSE